MTAATGVAGQVVEQVAGSGVRVTDRDRAVLGWLGRVRVATREQVGRRWGMSARVAQRRLKKLEDVGLVRSQVVAPVGVKMVAATAEGVRAAGVALPVSSQMLSRDLFHAYELTDLTIDYEQMVEADATVLTEREIGWEASTLQVAGWRLGYRRDGEAVWHVPDLAVIRPGEDRALAVEFEASVKSARRLDQLIGGYAASPVFTEVHYVCTPRARQAVQRAVERVGGDARIKVRVTGWVPTAERDGMSLVEAQRVRAGGGA